jgi:integrase
MALAKQAKIISDKQVRAVLAELDARRYPLRDRVMFLLSMKAGMRAVEIASITWAMVTDAEGNIGDVIALQNRASKGRGGGRIIPVHPDLKTALVALNKERGVKARPDWPIIHSERDHGLSAGRSLYGFTGCIPGSGWSAVLAIAAGGRSSRVRRGGSARSAAACGMSKCWLDTQASAPLPDISSMTQTLSAKSLLSFKLTGASKSQK